TMDAFTIHPWIAYSQHDTLRNVFAPDQCWPIIWDLRDAPEYSRQVSNLEESPSRLKLSQPATRKAVKIMHIECNDFPESWPVQVIRDDGNITLGDVLSAIHATLKMPLSREEYDRLPRRQQLKVSWIFEQRCKMTLDEAQRDACRAHGVIRMDCLVDRIWFDSLTVSPNAVDTWILALRQ
ncbi:hypothetical protein CPC08DRAFT_598938, partial [Agrocybe pediades]